MILPEASDRKPKSIDDRLINMTVNSSTLSINLSSAKRALEENDWQHYDYYAAYSSLFVADILDYFSLTSGNRVLDPWNGTGTTTKVAGLRGLCATGYDKNPVMTIVAKAGMVNTSAIDRDIDSQCQKIIEEASNLPNVLSQYYLEDDPLHWWFSASTVRYWRKLERALQQQLVCFNHLDFYQPIVNWMSVDDLSPFAAFFYVAAFRSVRDHLIDSQFASSNPTWIKIAKKEQPRLHLEQATVFQSFQKSVENLKRSLFLSSCEIDDFEITISTGCSTSLSLPDKSINAVITSPPYCTRIDYAVATRPELAFLGVDKIQFDSLRRKIMGTTTVPKVCPLIMKEWGKTCVQTLAKVENHHTVASDTYYIKNFAQYFDNLYRSMKEIYRVLVPGGQCAFVVQDSFYKNIHINLPRIVQEMAMSLEWLVIGCSNYEINNNFASINNRAKYYRETFQANESAIILKKK